MTVVADKPLGQNSPGSRIPGADRASVELFVKVFDAYQRASQTVKDIVETMSHIINDPQAERDEMDAAIDTLIEALFPASKDSTYGADILVLKAGNEADAESVIADHTRQEQRFSEAVKKLMGKKGMTQEQLAKAIGVTQPAIAMLLSRKCRPQKATLTKIANALGVDPNDIWQQS